jgi:hypothetical protein
MYILVVVDLVVILYQIVDMVVVVIIQEKMD